MAQATDESAGRGRRAVGEFIFWPNVFATLHVANKLGDGENVVTLLRDTGERYVDFPL